MEKEPEKAGISVWLKKGVVALGKRLSGRTGWRLSVVIDVGFLISDHSNSIPSNFTEKRMGR